MLYKKDMYGNIRKNTVRINLIILLILLQIIICQSNISQWNILTTRGSLNSIKFKNGGTGFIASNSGIILKTTNNGQYWKYLTCIGDYNLNSLYFVNNNTGFVIAYVPFSVAKIFKTTNSGDNWTEKYSMSQFYSFLDINFADSLKGWVVGQNGKILKTTNGGNNWFLQVSNTNVDLNCVLMINEQTGFICGGYGYNRRLLKTSDGGNNWNTIIADSGQFLKKIFFINANTGWLLDDPSSIWRTTNGGNNWIKNSHGLFGNFNSFYFIDSVNGWMAGRYGIYKTTNAGINWMSQIYHPPQTDEFNFFDMKFIDALNGTACGYNSCIYNTTNGGLNWLITQNTIEGNINSIYFVNNYAGWAVSSTGKIAGTQNGGLTWNIYSDTNEVSLNNLMFVNSNNGWIACNDGNVFKTSNSGINWQKINTNNNLALKSINFVNQAIGWVVGDYGTILKSTTGGNSWFAQNSGVNTGLNSVKFINNNTGFIAGDTAILKTTNSGLNWVNFVDSSFKYNSLVFVNSLTGFMTAFRIIPHPYPPNTTYIRKILKTTNAGLSWQVKFNQTVNGPLSEFTSISFIDSLTGWVVSNGYENNIKKTETGGDTWTNDNPFQFNRRYSSVFALTSNFVWASGETGTIISKYNGIPIGIINNHNEIPGTSRLHQNYPNPFNPSTKIHYDISEKTIVIIKIYNLLGQELQTLLHEEKLPGSYDVDFDSHAFSSGVYFYVLRTNNLSETKKMILLK